MSSSVVLDINKALLAVVDENERRISGFAARGVDEAWWRRVLLDAQEDIGAVVTVVRDRSPLAVFDVASASNINRRLRTLSARVAQPSFRCLPKAASQASSSSHRPSHGSSRPRIWI